MTDEARSPVSVVVDNVRSLDNVGMIFRLCELTKCEHLYLTGYTGYPELPGDERPPAVIERHNQRIAKTAVYALPYQPWTQAVNPVPLVEEMKDKGYKIVSLEQTEDSQDYHRVDYELPLALVVGHERLGVRDELLELSDMVVQIPILGGGNSHNAAAAVGIVLYEILRGTKLI